MSMHLTTTLLRARVPSQRLKKAEKILAQLGMKPSDAVNMLLAQIELRQALPFDVTTRPPQLLSAEQQAEAWTESLGVY